MARQVLVAMDESDQSTRALEFAFDQFPGAEFTVLHVINPVDRGYGISAMETESPAPMEEWYEVAEETADRLFEAARELADERGADLATTVETGKPPHVIPEYAEERGVDHVVVGSRGRTGASRILLGSVAEAVVRRSPVPVTVVR